MQKLGIDWQDYMKSISQKFDFSLVGDCVLYQILFISQKKSFRNSISLLILSFCYDILEFEIRSDYTKEGDF